MSCASTNTTGRGDEQGLGHRSGGLRFREEASAGRLALTLWPSRLYALPVALFTFLWLRFLWRWYALILLATAEDARGFLLLFGLPFLLAGMSLIGTSLRLALGRSMIVLDANRLVVVEHAPFAGTPAFVLPSLRIRGFVAESATRCADDDRDLDGWHVRVDLDEGPGAILPLPVRTHAEAELVARRLSRGLVEVRDPAAYRDLPRALA